MPPADANENARPVFATGLAPLDLRGLSGAWPGGTGFGWRTLVIPPTPEPETREPARPPAAVVDLAERRADAAKPAERRVPADDIVEYEPAPRSSLKPLDDEPLDLKDVGEPIPFPSSAEAAARRSRIIRLAAAAIIFATGAFQTYRTASSQPRVIVVPMPDTPGNVIT